MLIQRFINTLPNRKDRINEGFDELSQRDERSKESEEEKIFFKTNVR